MSKFISLTQGKIAIVDDEDFEQLNKHRWFAVQDTPNLWYAIRIIRENGKSRTIRMHREILKPKKDKMTDHINGNGLDNRRANLREVDQSLNQHNRHKLQTNNSSGFNGVSWDKKRRKWSARIELNGEKKYLGHFKSENNASLAYQQAKEAYLRKEKSYARW